jgi:hypothetical protein
VSIAEQQGAQPRAMHASDMSCHVCVWRLTLLFQAVLAAPPQHKICRLFLPKPGKEAFCQVIIGEQVDSDDSDASNSFIFFFKKTSIPYSYYNTEYGCQRPTLPNALMVAFAKASFVANCYSRRFKIFVAVDFSLRL